MEEWKTIEPGIWSAENPGNSIEGRLLVKQPKTATLSALYSIETARGIYKVWGSTVLDERMQYVNIGQKCRITFVRMEKSKKGHPLKIFKVEVLTDTTPTIELRVV